MELDEPSLTVWLGQMTPAELLTQCRRMCISLHIQDDILYYAFDPHELRKQRGLEVTFVTSDLERVLRAAAPALRVLLAHEQDVDSDVGVRELPLQ